MQQRRVRLFRL